MRSDNKKIFSIFFVGLLIGILIKVSAPFSFFNFGWAKVFKIKDLNYTGSASQDGQYLRGGACSN